MKTPSAPTAHRPTNAPPLPNSPSQRRIKLIIFTLIFGPMVLFGLYHIGRAVDKMIHGIPVGYEQREGPPGVGSRD